VGEDRPEAGGPVPRQLPEFCDIHPNGLKGPTGRAITTGKTAPDILVRIDEHLYAITHPLS